MCRTVPQFLFAIAVLLAILMAGDVSSTAAIQKVKEPPNPPATSFNGVPRQIDYINGSQNGSQVTITKTSQNELIAFVKTDAIESILALALGTKADVSVEAAGKQPAIITAVYLKAKPGLNNPAQGQAQVLAIWYDDKNDKFCGATVFFNNAKVNVWTKSAQMQRILETAIREGLVVGSIGAFFAYDPKTFEITRGQLNNQ